MPLNVTYIHTCMHYIGQENSTMSEDIITSVMATLVHVLTKHIKCIPAKGSTVDE